MTEPAVPVTQADIGWAESAAQHLCHPADRDAAIRLLADAFARHRIAHQPAPVEGDETLVERMAEFIRDASCCGYTEADGSRSYCSREKVNPKSCECFDGARAILPILTQARAAARREGMEKAARIAWSHYARIPNHDPDIQGDDLVAQGYGNASLNIATAIRTAIEQGAPATR